jgi:hypothetical protein
MKPNKQKDKAQQDDAHKAEGTGTEIEVQDDAFVKEHQDKVDALVKALVAGAHSLFITPVIVNKTIGSKINRLPLLSYVNHKDSRYFVLSALSKHYHCSMNQVAYAVQQIVSKHLAYVDSVGIDSDDVKAMGEAFEEALIKRGDNGVATASLDSSAKIYIRDLRCPKPIANKGKSRKPIVAPDWLTTGIADEPDKDNEHAQAPTETEEIIAESKEIAEVTEE